MIADIDITGVGGYVLDEPTKKYISKKIGRLDRMVTRHARKTINASVKIEEVNRDNGNKYEVEVIVNVPDHVIKAKDSTMNVMAATDIVERKLAGQLRKYKQNSLAHVGRRNVLARFKRSFGRETQ
ncbi:MAG: ribosome-associated translation inhibitor RaiA [Candidatus Nanogingivalaceae bacterium]|nr:ribosome-associated translation inhibitor RaiA [Candidatus Nanogingivalaceae bacterium]